MADQPEWTPTAFELAFGLKQKEGRDRASTDAPAELDEGLTLRGAIDLVEQKDGQLRGDRSQDRRPRGQPDPHRGRPGAPARALRAGAGGALPRAARGRRPALLLHGPRPLRDALRAPERRGAEGGEAPRRPPSITTSPTRSCRPPRPRASAAAATTAPSAARPRSGGCGASTSERLGAPRDLEEAAVIATRKRDGGSPRISTAPSWSRRRPAPARPPR